MERNLLSLPEEIFLNFFSWIDSLKELGRLAFVCKKFYFLLHEEILWKRLCCKYWNEKELSKILIDLEFVQRESGKDWFWFAKCFSNEEKEDGFFFNSFISTQIEDCFICIGEKKNGLMKLGLIVSSNGLFGGIFKDGKLTNGFEVHPGGERYEGQFKDGLFNGLGTLIDSNGNKYSGFWLDGTFNGCGSTITHKGGHYEGEFKNGCRNGNGILRYSDGTIYSGEFSQGNIQGRGTMSFPNGFKYEGNWERGIPVDVEASIDPCVKECIQMAVCTSYVVGESTNSGQFGYKCKTCKKKFCCVCWATCHNQDIDHNVIVKELYGCGIVCYCATTNHTHCVSPPPTISRYKKYKNE